MRWCFKTNLQLPKGQLDFVEQWPVMDPNELAFLLISYLLFVLKVGPILMGERSALRMNGLLIPYNMFKIFNSGLLTWRFFDYLADKGLFPETSDHEKVTVYIIAGLYWKFLATKLLDLFDTVFYVLRKKNNQVTFLHVYYHVFMVISFWTALKYDPSDHWSFMAFLNSFVHTIIYTYYCGAAMGPTFARYLWWKKYLTMMQLVQLVLILGHIMVQSYLSECPIPAIAFWVCISNATLFLVLFLKLYIQRYKRPRGKRSSIYLGYTRWFKMFVRYFARRLS